MVEQIDLSDGTPFFHQINGQEFVVMSAEAYLVMHTRFEQIKMEIAEAAEARIIARMREPDAGLVEAVALSVAKGWYGPGFDPFAAPEYYGMAEGIATAALAAAADAMEVGDA